MMAVRTEVVAVLDWLHRELSTVLDPVFSGCVLLECQEHLEAEGDSSWGQRDGSASRHQLNQQWKRTWHYYFTFRVASWYVYRFSFLNKSKTCFKAPWQRVKYLSTDIAPSWIYSALKVKLIHTRDLDRDGAYSNIGLSNPAFVSCTWKYSIYNREWVNTLHSHFCNIVLGDCEMYIF